MKRFIKGQSGFTLIEIIIVLAILAILAALIVPQLGGFLARGHRAAYDADKHVLELAVMTYWTADPLTPRWPIHGASVGQPVDANNDGDFVDVGDHRHGMINIPRLVVAGLLADNFAVRSVDGRSGRHIFPAGVVQHGSYVWYVADGHGTVRSLFRRAAPPAWLSGFQGVYP